jgi:predicted dehydrogenase
MRKRPRASSRRNFIRTSALAAGAGLARTPSLKALGYVSPNEKLNIAGIGAGGRSFRCLREVQAGVENIVALADVDWVRGAQGFEEWPKAAKHRDFRRMLDKEHRNIDAVVIGTPDHTHAVAALACLQLGKHVYLEKPLTRTSGEARLLTRAAERYDWVATQMGNQGYSHDATRVACEILWAGEIGDVREVHAWTRPAVWPQGMTTVPASTAVPDTLDWDLWLGPAAWRPFTAGDEAYKRFIVERGERLGRPPRDRGYGYYLPFNWRGFYDFGSSLIGDWGVHILGPANWALQLSPESLISVECTHKDSSPPTTFPDELTLRYEFAARPGMPPVTVYWHHHKDGDAYTPPGMTVEEARKIPDTGPQVGPPPGPPRRPAPSGGAGRGGGPPRPQGTGYNCIFVGSKGHLGTSRRGEGVGLLPGSRWAEYELPNAYLPRSPGASTGSNMAAHCRDWVRACKGGAPACSHFGVAGRYTEWLLLGAAAVHYEGKLLWDSAKGEFINNKDANQWVKPTFREGWEIDL